MELLTKSDPIPIPKAMQGGKKRDVLKTRRTFVCVEGGIGAGKTTFVKVLKEELETRNYNVAVIEEPVLEWEKSGLLKKFYNDKKKYAYVFQNFVYLTILKSMMKCLAENPYANIFIGDRSIYSAYYFFVPQLREDGEMSQMEYEIHNEWFGICKSLVPMIPTHFIFITTPIVDCIKRINKRQREGETEIKMKYMENLEQKHIKFLNMKDGAKLNNRMVPVLQICFTEEKLFGMPKFEMIEEVIDFLKTKQHTELDTTCEKL